MSPRSHTALLLVASLSALAGCSALGVGGPAQPAPEAPVAANQQYLSKGGANTALDLGPDQKSLLSEYSALQELKLKAELRAKELEGQNEQLRAQLRNAESERDSQRNQSAGAEAELVRLRKQLHERDAKILALTLEKTVATHNALLLRIAALEQRLEAANAPTDVLAAPPQGR